MFSFLEDSVMSYAASLFPWLPPLVADVTLTDCVPRLQALRPSTVVVHLPSVASELQAAGVTALCVPVSKHQHHPLRGLLSVLDEDSQKVQVDEYFCWSHYVRLPAQVRLEGEVVHGYGKGASELGFPTANIVPKQSRVTSQLVPGVYCGLATLEGFLEPFQAAVSIGWNPQFGNKEKTTEVHLLHKFDSGFYGKKLSVRLVAYLRAETTFASVEELVKAIEYDVRLTREVLSHR